MEPIFLFRIEPSHIRCSSSFLWADKRIFLLLGIVGCIISTAIETSLVMESILGIYYLLLSIFIIIRFAAEVFHCLHQEMMTTAARGHGLAMRLQLLEADFPSIEIPILSQTDHSTFFYDPG